jgi:hypothetical protein
MGLSPWDKASTPESLAFWETIFVMFRALFTWENAEKTLTAENAENAENAEELLLTAENAENAERDGTEARPRTHARFS